MKRKKTLATSVITLAAAATAYLFWPTPFVDSYSMYDLNGDRTVDTLDLLELFAQWGSSGPQADFNADGVVNTQDFLEFNAHWGPCVEPVLDDSYVSQSRGLFLPLAVWAESEQDCIDAYMNRREQFYESARHDPVVVMYGLNRTGWTFAQWDKFNRGAWSNCLDCRKRIIDADNEPEG